MNKLVHTEALANDHPKVTNALFNLKKGATPPFRNDPEITLP
ncbi:MULTISPECIES: hypothetical protein [unclassified Endozoicomonas]|nr:MULTISPECIES: hypothetical protein [unclassified Endozoicomonas]